MGGAGVRTGVAVRLCDEAFKGFRRTVALGRWEGGLRCRRTHGGGVTGPHPLEHDAEPDECDQRELVEEQMRDGFDHRVGHFRPPGIVDGIINPQFFNGLGAST